MFFKGGRTLADAINPNLGTSSVAASPLILHIEIPWSPDGDGPVEDKESGGRETFDVGDVSETTVASELTKSTTPELEEPKDGGDQEKLNDKFGGRKIVNLSIANLINNTEDLVNDGNKRNPCEMEYIRAGESNGTREEVQEKVTGE